MKSKLQLDVTLSKIGVIMTKFEVKNNLQQASNAYLFTSIELYKHTAESIEMLWTIHRLSGNLVQSSEQ